MNVSIVQCWKWIIPTASILAVTTYGCSEKRPQVPALPLPVQGCITEGELAQAPGTYGGCGNIAVYAAVDSAHLLVIEVDTAVTKISEYCKMYDLAIDKGIRIQYYSLKLTNKNQKPLITYPVCSDVVNPEIQWLLETEKVIKGTVFMSKRNKIDIEGQYYCSIKLENLLLSLGNNKTLPIPNIAMKNVLVGWIAG